MYNSNPPPAVCVSESSVPARVGPTVACASGPLDPPVEPLYDSSCKSDSNKAAHLQCRLPVVDDFSASLEMDSILSRESMMLYNSVITKIPRKIGSVLLRQQFAKLYTNSLGRVVYPPSRDVPISLMMSTVEYTLFMTLGGRIATPTIFDQNAVALFKLFQAACGVSQIHSVISTFGIPSDQSMKEIGAALFRVRAMLANSYISTSLSGRTSGAVFQLHVCFETNLRLIEYRCENNDLVVRYSDVLDDIHRKVSHDLSLYCGRVTIQARSVPGDYVSAADVQSLTEETAAQQVVFPILQRIEEFRDKVIESFSDITGTFSNIRGLTAEGGAIPQAFESVNQIATPIANLFGVVGGALTFENLYALIKYGSIFIYLMSRFWRNPGPAMRKIFTFAKVALLFTWGPGIANGFFTLLEKFNEIYARDIVRAIVIPGVLGAQSASNDDPIVTQAGGRATFVHDLKDIMTPFFNMRAFDGALDIQAFDNILNDQPVELHSMDALERILVKVEKLWTIIRKYIGPPPDVLKTVEGFPDVLKFVESSQVLLGQLHINATIANVAHVKGLYQLCAVLREKYGKNPTLTKILNDFQPKLAALETSLRSRLGAFGLSRYDPTMLHIMGEPGTGKSTTQEMIKDILVKDLLKGNEVGLRTFAEDRKAFVYQRQDSEYWEGVSPAVKLVSYPDFLADKQNENSTVKHEAELIKLISSEPYIPNMAFGEKGKISIAPDYVMLSSNQRCIPGKTIEDKGAFARRQLVFEQVYLDEDGNEKVNGIPCKPSASSTIDPTRWRYYKMQTTRSFRYERVPNMNAFTFDELVMYVMARRRQLILKYLSMTRVRQTAVSADVGTFSSFLDAHSGALDPDEFMTRFRERTVAIRAQANVPVIFPVFEEWTHRLFGTFLHTPWEQVDQVTQARFVALWRTGPNCELSFETFKEKMLALGDIQFLAIVRDNAEQPDFQVESVPVPEGTSTLMQQFVSAVSHVPDFNLGWAGKMTVVVGSVVAAIAVLKSLFSFFSDDHVAESVDDEDVVVRPVVDGSLTQQGRTYVDPKMQRRRKLGKMRSTKIKLVKPEGAHDVSTQASQQISIAVSQAPKFVWSMTSSGGSRVQYVVQVSNRVFMFNHHCLGLLQSVHDEEEIPDSILTFTRLDGKASFTSTFSRLKEGLGDVPRDIYFVKLDEAPMGKSILNHWVNDGFVEDRLLHNMTKTSVGMWTPEWGNQISHGSTIVGGKTIEEDGDTRVFSQVWSAIFNSETGDCGSLLYIASDDGGCSGKFAGYLCAGNNGYGPSYFTAMTRRQLVDGILRAEGNELDVDGTGREIFGIHSKKHHFYTNVTDILTPSESPAKEPFKASVNPNDPMVYAQARSKYCHHAEIPKIEIERLKRCLNEKFARDLKTAHVPFIPKIMPFNEAINGIPGTSFEGIDLSTSAGAPYNMEGINKRDLCGEWINGEFVIGPKFEQLYAEVMKDVEDLKSGMIPAWFYTDVVKSETLPIEKVLKGKGRLVSAASLRKVIVCRMFYGSLLQFTMDNHLTNGVATGDNMVGEDAHLLTIQHLNMACGEDTHGAGDMSAYDAHHSPQALVGFNESYIECFTPLFANLSTDMLRAYRTYGLALEHAFHIRGNEMDMWNGSLPSGDPLTSLINSYLNHAMLMYSVWRSRGFEEGFFTEFFDNVLVRTMGDDNRFTVSPLWRENLTEKICAEGYAVFGHIYTNDTKDGISDELRAFDKTTFLKRSTRWEPIIGKWVAPLDLNTILEIPLWTRGIGMDRVPDMDQALKNADTMSRELSLHDDATWNFWLPKYIRMFAEQGWQPRYTSRNLMLRNTWNLMVRI